MTISSLANLGRNHNRWRVRDVLTEILQAIREPESALAASEGLEEADWGSVDWSLSEFSIKSLHPSSGPASNRSWRRATTENEVGKGRA
jgi:hypothetical protein